MVNGKCKSEGIVPFNANVELSVVFVGETMQFNSEQIGLISHEVSPSAHVWSGLGVVVGQANSASSGFLQASGVFVSSVVGVSILLSVVGTLSSVPVVPSSVAVV